jgi:hypothetical protein
MDRYYCGNGDGMFDDPDGSYILYEDHLKIVDAFKKELEKLQPLKSDDGFNEFWELYKRKDNKSKALKSWKRLKSKDKVAIMANVKLFVLAHPDVKYRPMAVTYLNGRRWEDELPNVKQVEQPSWASRNTWVD